jgi:hypothetical protein
MLLAIPGAFPHPADMPGVLLDPPLPPVPAGAPPAPPDPDIPARPPVA